MTQHAVPRHQNRLIQSTSPYLLQHAHNPVDWYPWGEEALARARAEDKPILLSIGYSACHWCHVMERESFEDEAIARLMNEHFVCVKVDREERPDLDDIYMAATLAMNQGQGGWPMTVFLTPDQEPFFAGTYFPPADRYGRPGLPDRCWRAHRRPLADATATGCAARRAEVTALPAARARAPRPAHPSGEDGAAKARATSSTATSTRAGAASAARPSSRPPRALSLLLRCHRRFGDERALEMVRSTLDEMARGGMYDQLGGGFHRYSVDERWLVPHFEKMLYDNAQLATRLPGGHQATGEPFYREVAVEMLDYVLREMTVARGRLLLRHRRRLRGRGGQVLRLDAGGGARGARRRGGGAAVLRVLRRHASAATGRARASRTLAHRRREVAAELGVDADGARARAWRPRRARLYEARRGACRPASTTRS